MAEQTDLDIQTHDHEPVPAGDDELLYCTVHPERETTLRCNKCGRPMCAQCAVRTPVGYRCRECLRQQQSTFFTASQRDYVIAGIVSAVLGGIAVFLLSNIGFFFFGIILAPMAGGIIPQAVLPLIGRRRGRWLGEVVVAGIVVGTLASQWPLVQVFLATFSLQLLVGALLWPLLYALLMASVAYGWFRFGPRI